MKTRIDALALLSAASLWLLACQGGGQSDTGETTRGSGDSTASTSVETTSGTPTPTTTAAASDTTDVSGASVGTSTTNDTADTSGCPSPGLEPPDCASCIDPDLAAPGCTTCKDPGRQPPECDTCVPGKELPDCVICSDPNAAGPTCEHQRFVALARGGAEIGVKANGQLVVYGVSSGTEKLKAWAEVDVTTLGATWCGKVVGEDTLQCFGYVSEVSEEPLDGIAFGKFALGEQHACAIVAGTDELKCWGKDMFGVLLPPPGEFVDVCSGRDHSCAIDVDGALHCWGDDDFGQSAPPPGKFKRVECNRNYSCAIDSTDEIVCWGDAEGGKTDPPPGPYKELSAGGHYACGLRMNGEASCWGFMGTPPTGVFTAIYAAADAFAESDVCGLRPDGEALCWGFDAEPTHFEDKDF